MPWRVPKLLRDAISKNRPSTFERPEIPKAKLRDPAHVKPISLPHYMHLDIKMKHMPFGAQHDFFYLSSKGVVTHHIFKKVEFHGHIRYERVPSHVSVPRELTEKLGRLSKHPSSGTTEAFIRVWVPNKALLESGTNKRRKIIQLTFSKISGNRFVEIERKFLDKLPPQQRY